MALQIVAVTLPDSPWDDAGWALRAGVAVEQAASTATWGHADLADTVAEAWAWGREKAFGRRDRYVAVADGSGQVVGSASLSMPSPDNAHLGEVWVAVHPDRRRRGVGRALAEHLEREVRAAGRRVALGGTDHAVEPARPAEGEAWSVVVPRSGSGTVPRDASSGFALALGYDLEQAERHSELRLPLEPGLLGRLEAQARHAAGTEYRVVTWSDEAPERRLADYALLHTRMSTDAPMAGLDVEEDVFDAARVRDFEQVHLGAGNHLLVAAAEHVATGGLVAFTVLVVREGDPPAAFQDATLVLREHRGHRLGMLVKIANLRRLRAAYPSAARIHTSNAVENTHMLAINVALGFVPAGVEGIWQKDLRPQDRA